MDDDHRSNLSVITNWIYKEVSGVSINIRIFRAVKKSMILPIAAGKPTAAIVSGFFMGV